MTHQPDAIFPHAAAASWRDPDDVDPNARAPRLIRGQRRYSVIVNLHRRSPREITVHHVTAANRFAADYEIGMGARISGERVAVDHLSAAGYSDTQLAALTRYREAVQSLGVTLSGLVIAVVLDNASLTEIAARLRTSVDRAQGRFASAMDRLSDHYDTDAADPVRVSRGPMVIDPRVTDIPQTSLGRKKVAGF